MRLPIEADLTLTFDTAIHVGTGRAEGLLQRTIRRTADGRVYVPASALKGALRQSAERLTGQLNRTLGELGATPQQLLARRHRGRSVQTIPCQAPHPETMCQSDEPCIVCRLFGNVFTGRRLLVDDALPAEAPREMNALSVLAEEGLTTFEGARALAQEELTQVQIDRRRRGAKEKALFSSAFAPAGLVFHSRLSGAIQTIRPHQEEAPAPELVLLAAALRALEQVGANASTGRGQCRIEVDGEALRAAGVILLLDDLIMTLDETLVFANL